MIKKLIINITVVLAFVVIFAPSVMMVAFGIGPESQQMHNDITNVAQMTYQEPLTLIAVAGTLVFVTLALGLVVRLLDRLHPRHDKAAAGTDEPPLIVIGWRLPMYIAGAVVFFVLGLALVWWT